MLCGTQMFKSMWLYVVLVSFIYVLVFSWEVKNGSPTRRPNLIFSPKSGLIPVCSYNWYLFYSYSYRALSELLDQFILVELHNIISSRTVLVGFLILYITPITHEDGQIKTIHLCKVRVMDKFLSEITFMFSLFVRVATLFYLILSTTLHTGFWPAWRKNRQKTVLIKSIG